jgi:hypothetical protein
MDTPMFYLEPNPITKKNHLIKKSHTQQWGKSTFENSIDFDKLDDGELSFYHNDTIFTEHNGSKYIDKFFSEIRKADSLMLILST